MTRAALCHRSSYHSSEKRETHALRGFSQGKPGRGNKLKDTEILRNGKLAQVCREAGFTISI